MSAIGHGCSGFTGGCRQCHSVATNGGLDVVFSGLWGKPCLGGDRYLYPCQTEYAAYGAGCHRVWRVHVLYRQYSNFHLYAFSVGSSPN